MTEHHDNVVPLRRPHPPAGEHRIEQTDVASLRADVRARMYAAMRAKCLHQPSLIATLTQKQKENLGFATKK